jgi:hypothetical protein
MTPIIHLHWAQAPHLLRGVSQGYTLCGAVAPGKQLTAFADDATCKKCLDKVKLTDAPRECDCCGVELEADPPHDGEHSNLCHQCNQNEAG